MGAKSDMKSNYSWRTIVMMSVGFGLFGLVFVGLQSGWRDGIVAGAVVAAAAVIFGLFMRQLQTRKNTNSK